MASAGPAEAEVQPPAEVPDWSALPQDLVRHLGDGFLLAAGDIDYYTSLRLVCSKWRSATTNPTQNGLTDPRFLPSNWALLRRSQDPVTENPQVLLVNVETGRFIYRSLPQLSEYSFGAAAGGLFLVGESEHPYRACLLNPLTGSEAHFKARMPVGGVSTFVAVTTTSPMRLFVASRQGGRILWADQESEFYQDVWVAYPSDPMSMASFAGGVFLTDRHGSIVTPVVLNIAVEDDDDGVEQQDSVQRISMMSTVIPGADAHPQSALGDDTRTRYYLVEFGGELFLVTRPWRGMPPELLVRKVDTVRRLLEPVRSIGSRAFFVSNIRCLAVDASKFHTLDGGCVCFVDNPVIVGGNYDPALMSVVRVADGVAEYKLLMAHHRPLTMDKVFTEYCSSMHYSEPCQTNYEDTDFLFDDFEEYDGPYDE